MKSSLILLAMATLLSSGAGSAAEIRVLSTQATEQAYRELIPQFQKASRQKVSTDFTGTLDADRRLAAGEKYDLVIMSSTSIDQHIKDGKVVKGSRVDLAKSGVAVAVRLGAPKPDISSADALRKTLLAAKSIGYSTGPSGQIVLAIFQRLGIADRIKPKLKQTPTGIFVGEFIALGQVDIGFQQVSELSQFPAITYVGPLPPALQQYTIFSAGIVAGAAQGNAAKALVKFLSSPAAASVFTKSGMAPP